MPINKLRSNGCQINAKRYSQVENNINLLQELDIVSGMKGGVEYYSHIIQNIQLDPKNPINSYIMWIFDKVEKLDTNSPVIHTPGHYSLPDIDVDFPITKRKFVIDYLREKYGKDRVCQMATFGRLQGRGAIKEVLRVNNVCDFETMNLITKDIPQEAEINDQMEESSETSILRWTLQNEPKILADWCKADENGVLTGEYAEFFAQAIRLEGTYKSQGKHAAGVLIAAEPLDKICPMINDKNSDEKIAGMGMSDLESMGHTKLDILGLLALDRLYSVNNLLQTGKVERDDNAI
jgi:DNA polymerase-3 subunit alpha